MRRLNVMAMGPPCSAPPPASFPLASFSPPKGRQAMAFRSQSSTKWRYRWTTARTNCRWNSKVARDGKASHAVHALVDPAQLWILQVCLHAVERHRRMVTLILSDEVEQCLGVLPG